MKALSVSLRLTAAAAVLGLSLVAAGPTAGQSAAPLLRVDSCDNFNYPSIVCEVSVIDAQGLPVDGLTADKFEVVDGASLARIASVTQTVSTKAQLSNMLVLDFGSNRGLGLDAVRDYGKRILQETANGDFVGLVGIGGPVDFGGSAQIPVTEGREFGFALAGDRRNDIINLIIRFAPPTSGSGVFPVFEAVCKALQLTARQSVGTRAIILVSDGIDDRSRSVCAKTDDVISEAIRLKIPIYTILVGAGTGGEDTLKTLARRTGGLSLERATSADDVVSRYKEIQERLKKRYVISFTASTPAENRDIPVAISASISGQRASDTVRVVSLYPRRPVINDVRVAANGSPVSDWKSTPLQGSIVVTPVIQARKVSQVIYTLNGTAQLSEEAPYALTFRSDTVPAGALQIPIRIVGEADRPLETTSVATLTLTIGAIEGQPTRVAAAADTGAVAVAPARPPAAEASVPTWLYFVVGGVALAAIVGAVIVVTMMRKGSAGESGSDDPTIRHGRGSIKTERTAGSEGASTGRITTRPDPISAPLVTDSATSEDKTQRMTRDGTSRFRKPLARLNVKSGKSAGASFDLGALLECKIGREVDKPAGHVYIESSVGRFVSRHHASILRKDDNLVLIPRSANSDTLVNGNIVPVGQELVIKPGDKLEFGDVAAEVVSL